MTFLNLKKIWLSFFLLFSLTLTLAGCSTSSNEDKDLKPVGDPRLGPSVHKEILRGPVQEQKPDAKDREVRIGLLLPLSENPLERTAKALRHAAELAVFEKGNEKFKLITRDTKGTAEGAVQAFRDLMDEKVELVLGPFFAKSVTAIAPLAKANRINVISFSNSNTVTERGIFAFGFSPDQEIFRIFNYATNNEVKNVAIIAPSTPYGEVAVRSANKAAQRFGATITQVAMYQPGVNPSTVIEQINFDNVEGVLIPESSKNLPWVLSYLNHFKPDDKQIRYLGTRLWENPRVLREPNLIGSWFASHNHSRWKLLESRFIQTFGYKPPRLASVAYDAVALSAVLASHHRGPDFSTFRITNLTGFEGIDGIFRLKADGTVERGLAVFEVTPNNFQMISPPAKSFL